MCGCLNNKIKVIISVGHLNMLPKYPPTTGCSLIELSQLLVLLLLLLPPVFSSQLVYYELFFDCIYANWFFRHLMRSSNTSFIYYFFYSSRFCLLIVYCISCSLVYRFQFILFCQLNASFACSYFFLQVLASQRLWVEGLFILVLFLELPCGLPQSYIF